jgi:hypothetical protein
MTLTVILSTLHLGSHMKKLGYLTITLIYGDRCVIYLVG